jgi:tetratricopeptide (TPR) repeat protein
MPRFTLTHLFVLALLATGLLFSQTEIHAQVTGGGSTENFKRPANPPVYHQPKVEPAGGRIKEDPNGKPGTKGTQNNGAAAAASKTSEPESSRTTNKATLPKWGGLKSGGGIATRPPAPTPAAAAPPTATTAPTYTDVEDAIEAGNNARDRKDYAEAERAYKLASQLAPNDERAVMGLGNIYLDQQRNEEAVAAYHKASELNPKSAAAFENLGDAYYRLAKYQESIDASTQSIRLAPETPGAYWTMTWATLTVGNGETAGNMAEAFVYRWRPLYSGDAPYYITFAGYVGYREAGRTEAANKLLETAPKSNECVDQNWVCRLLKYHRHRIKAEQLLSEAKDNGQMTEARTYIGLDLALAGRREEALPHLRWVVSNGERNYTEYPLAKYWLAKLEAGSAGGPPAVSAKN